MIGAILGDIVGSVYEFSNKKRKTFRYSVSRHLTLTILL